MDVGFIGLGIMGAPMAGHLVARGHRLHLKTRRSVPEHPLPAGDIASAREVAERSDVVIREGAPLDLSAASEGATSTAGPTASSGNERPSS